ncbi:hypothetical protein Y032_0012g1674 [Ancylostoma ceylanicum]|uniref:Uncharacterized protein n=1 Tax=Ancylostoma ceylanicum TaxID=53326 RepID=A0A016VCU9_9BILA|nr:hypothetical protein Y032_0012g1674 [Ancylostoma ceylanicum]
MEILAVALSTAKTHITLEQKKILSIHAKEEQNYVVDEQKKPRVSNVAEYLRAEHLEYINEGIRLIMSYKTRLTGRFRSTLSAYYHVEKHGEVTFLAYYEETFTNVPQKPWPREKIYEVYFEKMPELLFTEENYSSTMISQDATTKSRRWMTRNGYIGYTKVPYNVVLDDTAHFLPEEIVATHYKIRSKRPRG